MKTLTDVLSDVDQLSEEDQAGLAPIYSPTSEVLLWDPTIENSLDGRPRLMRARQNS
jgi:hypothetical protein